jgi:hypothetical protein
VVSEKKMKMWNSQHWTLWEFHIFIFFSETTKQISTKPGRNVHWMVIYKICVFGADRKSNMAARAYNVFWLVGSQDIILKVDHLRTIYPMFALNWLTGFRGEDF